MRPSTLFTKQEKEQIIEAIRRAEGCSSIEIRVHIENHSSGAVLDRAVAVFDKLGMRETADRNGVLVYVALKDRVSAIIGDENVNKYVPRDFWQECARTMNTQFGQARFAEGIRTVIGKIEEALKAHFPCQPDDVNELPDDISFNDQ